MNGRPFQQQVELILSLTKRDLKARYKDSILGFFWSLFRPAFLTLVLWMVFGKLLRLDLEQGGVPYWLHVLVSVLTWGFCVGSLSDATHSVVGNGNLLKKVRLDSEVFPISSIAANALHFVLAFGIIALLLPFTGVGYRAELLLLPLVVLIAALFVLGVTLYLSALNVLYRDVGSALELLILVWFYITPIIYPINTARDAALERAGSGAFIAYMLNPMAAIMGGVRRTVLYPADTEIADTTLLLFLAVAAAVSVILVGTGWVVFRRLSHRFADEL